MYCKAGDKPTLTYQFSGQAKKTFKSEFAPIDVIVKQSAIDSTGNFSGQGYQISAYSTNDFITRTFIVRDYYVVDSKIPVDTFEYRFNFVLHGKRCNEIDYPNLAYINPSTIAINPNITCASAENKTSIQVTHNGLVIFQDQANTNVTFSVQCARCPDGQHECASPIYPGYCCIDCASTAASIRAITNELRYKNG